MNAIETSDDYRGSMDRCLAMVRRHGPRLMRQGGGGLKNQERRHTDPREIALAIQHFTENRSIAETADRCGRSYDWALTVLTKAGVRTAKTYRAKQNQAKEAA